MKIKAYGGYLMHSGKSKSKYKGGFVNGKNTSAYNHDYYMRNKEKWKDNEDGEDGERPNNWNDIYEDKDEQIGISYDGNEVSTGYHNKKTGETTGQTTYTTNGYTTSRKRNGGKISITDPKLFAAAAKKEDAYDAYREAVESGEAKDVKSTTVFKRGEGIGGGPSGNANYGANGGSNGRKKESSSTTTVNKRKKGRKPVGRVVFSKN